MKPQCNVVMAVRPLCDNEADQQNQQHSHPIAFPKETTGGETRPRGKELWLNEAGPKTGRVWRIRISEYPTFTHKSQSLKIRSGETVFARSNYLLNFHSPILTKVENHQWNALTKWAAGVCFQLALALETLITPLAKLTLWTQSHGGLFQMILLFNWVIVVAINCQGCKFCLSRLLTILVYPQLSTTTGPFPSTASFPHRWASDCIERSCCQCQRHLGIPSSVGKKRCNFWSFPTCQEKSGSGSACCDMLWSLPVLVQANKPCRMGNVWKSISLLNSRSSNRGGIVISHYDNPKRSKWIQLSMISLHSSLLPSFSYHLGFLTDERKRHENHSFDHHNQKLCQSGTPPAESSVHGDCYGKRVEPFCSNNWHFHTTY